MEGCDQRHEDVDICYLDANISIEELSLQVETRFCDLRLGFWGREPGGKEATQLKPLMIDIDCGQGLITELSRRPEIQTPIPRPGR
jgi:hypothetical protein